MAIKNRYNDPAMGQAFESLAGMFAPISGSDLAGYAAADVNRQKAAQEAQRLGLVDMFASGQGGDNAGIAAGLYTPAQSWGAVQMGDQTTRRGQDIDLQGTIYGADRGYAASTENNVRDNARARELGLLGDQTTRRGQDIGLQGTIYGADRDYQASTENNTRDNETDLRTSAMDNLLTPLDPGQQTRAIPDEVWRALNLPGMPATEEYRNTTPGGDDRPASVQEYEYYAAGETAAGREPMPYAQFSVEKARAGATHVNVGGSSKLYDKLDEKSGEMFSMLVDQGSQAGANAARVEELANLIDTVPTGATAWAKQALGNWGIKTEGISDIEAMGALINQLVPAQRPAGSGTMSDRDIELFRASLPGLMNTPEGNRKIVDTMRGVMRYQQAQAQIANSVAAREITPDEGRAALMQIENPLAGLAAAASQTAAEPGQRGSITVNSDAEYDALPSGAVFVGPDGKQRRKP